MAVPIEAVVLGVTAAGGITAFFIGSDWLERRRRADVMTNGASLVGCIVQANRELFQPGGGDAPAQILISFDNPDGEGLEELAERVSRLEREDHASPDQQRVAALVRDETYRPDERSLLPVSFTGGRKVYSVGVMIERRLLLAKRLETRFIHCKAVPGDTGRVYMTPPDAAA